MRVWNLTELSEIQDTVVSSRAPVHSSSVRRRGKPSRFAIGLGIAALAGTISLGVGQTSAHNVFIPVPEAQMSQSIAAPEPPLEQLFANRFHDAWSEATERALLTRIEERRDSEIKRDPNDRVVDAVFSNQTEDPESGAPRLTRERVAEILRRSRNKV